MLMRKKGVIHFEAMPKAFSGGALMKGHKKGCICSIDRAEAVVQRCSAKKVF